MKTAKVTEVRGVRPWNGKNGTIFYHDIVLDNGDRGSIGKRSEGSIKVGDVINYTIDGGRISVLNPNNGPRGSFIGKPAASPAAMAMSYAKDLVVANLAKSEKPLDMAALADRVINTADRFNAWIKANS